MKNRMHECGYCGLGPRARVALKRSNRFFPRHDYNKLRMRRGDPFLPPRKHSAVRGRNAVAEISSRETAMRAAASPSPIEVSISSPSISDSEQSKSELLHHLGSPATSHPSSMSIPQVKYLGLKYAAFPP